MLTTLTPHLATLAAIEVDPTASINKARVVAIAALGLFLIIVSVAAVAGPGRKGNTRRAVDVSVATIICLVPGVLGFLGVGLAFGASILGWAIPGLSS